MMPILAAALALPPKPPVVADGRVVRLHYTLRDLDGTVLRTTRTGEPLTYLRGPNRLPPGIERAIEGLAVGERVEAVLGPEDAFGVRRGTGPIEMSRRELPPGVLPLPGKAFHASRGGQSVYFRIVRSLGKKLWVELDHPLAGRTLVLEAEVVDVRLPTPAECRRTAAPAFAEA